jgi:phosphate starvation-inducible PhoH-like protein
MPRGRKPSTKTTSGTEGEKTPKLFPVDKKQMDINKAIDSIQVRVVCKNENQKKVINAIKDNEITIISGLPGTGKTFLACAEALKLLKSGQCKKILIVKSITELRGESLNALPGNVDEKLEPFMTSFIDNFEKIIGEDLTQKLKDLGIIKYTGLAHLRGRSIDDSVIIGDEIQNISIDNMHTLLTRIGNNSKIILLGDKKQKDIKNRRESSLEIIMEMFKDEEDFGCVELNNPNDIVRNKIIQRIEAKFDEFEEKRYKKPE